MGHFKSYHLPEGDPCIKCHRSANSHRVYHIAKTDPCEKCGLPASKHRVRTKERIQAKYERRKGTDVEIARQKRAYEKRKAKGFTFVGIDGEGIGYDKHRYVMMGASSEDGEFQQTIIADEGDELRTEDCLNFLINLPTWKTKFFSYAFNYDLTKMLQDLDNKSLYFLFRPELRARHGEFAKYGPRPVIWNGWALNLQGSKFTVKRGKKKIVIWDIFKFYQGKFVTALKDWKVGNEEIWKRMSAMKDKRSGFADADTEAMTEYMLEECQCMGELARKLVNAHEQAGLKLKTFYGAGSSGAAMLNVMGIRSQIVPVPDAMKHAVASAFFGGRFENSVIGSIRERVFNYDISSAYPYHTTFLPCLIHGSWELTKDRKKLDSCSVALVRYRLGGIPRNTPLVKSWGPFPFRDREGSISFPIQSGGGWVWKNEYLAGEKIFSHIQFREAWVYRSSCNCQPFDRIPKYYVHRLLLGKEGPGIVIKLAVNSVYGKLAQSVGNALFNSWIWAGLITSGCRAQILEVLGLHKEPKNLLMVATDGIYTRERLPMPSPRDTGTAGAVTDKGKLANKPLGGWEEKEVEKGIFVARPGIYFPLNPTEAELKDVRGRGVGKGVVLENWKRITECWEQFGVNGTAIIANVSRFCGAKTSIAKQGNRYSRALASDGILPSYGEWVGRRVEMGFNPMPKRERINPDGLTLKLRTFPKDQESVPYTRALVSRETLEMRAATQELLEQPDGDYLEVDDAS